RCAKLETLADETAGDRKHAEQELKVVQAAFETAGGAKTERNPRFAGVRERYAKARDRIAARLQEMRDAENWKRWSNVPRLEKLVERMEALKAVEDNKEAAAQMKLLQVEWKQVGPAPKEKSEALWARVKAAGDEVYKKT